MPTDLLPTTTIAMDFAAYAGDIRRREATIMNVRGLTIGGTGHAGVHLPKEFDAGHIPASWDGHNLKPATLNLVLEVNVCFRTPIAGGATKQYVANDETCYLQAIQLRVINSRGNEICEWLPGLIHRNRSHPAQFDNVIEVIAPDIAPLLKSGTKDWLELSGPFESVMASQ